jgi:hypothetical protein
VVLASEPAAVAKGHYFYQSRGGKDCHGPDGGGRQFINDGNGIRISGPNIVAGGVTTQYKAEDWARILRHGVRANGQAAFIMPSEDYAR